MRISDWSSDVCSSDLLVDDGGGTLMLARIAREAWGAHLTPAGPRAFLFFRDASGAVSEVVEGDATYARENAALPADPPTGYRPLVGRYAAHGEEGDRKSTRLNSSH